MTELPRNKILIACIKILHCFIKQLSFWMYGPKELNQKCLIKHEMKKFSTVICVFDLKLLYAQCPDGKSKALSGSLIMWIMMINYFNLISSGVPLRLQRRKFWINFSCLNPHFPPPYSLILDLHWLNLRLNLIIVDPTYCLRHNLHVNK